MNTRELDKFINYKPIFDSNPTFILDEIISLGKSYLTPEGINLIKKAYVYSQQAHAWQKRFSGEPYIIHPLMTAKYLMRINPGATSIAVALLHDILEDTPISYDELKSEFGEEIATMCEKLVKVSKVKYTGQDRALETLRKTFLSMGEDLRVIFIKLADRIHNIQTIHYHPKPERRKMIAEETIKIYVPIAQRLGLSVFQLYLENLSFKVTNEKEFFKIFNYQKKKFGFGEGYIETGKRILNDNICKGNIKCLSIKGRLKSPYRIYKKMQKYGTQDPNKILDVMAFRVVTDSVVNCYNILGLLHSEFTPIVQRIKDYISLPKANGYKSLHTTLLGMFDFPVEIQIRTKAMDEIAEYGVAAHFAYKEGVNHASLPKNQLTWIKNLQKTVQTYSSNESNEDLKKVLQVELLEHSIFVYTPTGEIKELPKGSNVLDFAFTIHTDFGLRFKNAYVNGSIVPIDYKIKTGDIVEIKKYNNKYTVSKTWLDLATTQSAKARITRHIKQLEKSKYIKEATETLNEKLKNFSLPLLHSKEDLIGRQYKGEELEKVLMKIQERQITPSRFIKDIYKLNLNPKILPEHQDSNQPKTSEPGVIIDGQHNMEYTLCPECDAKKRDKIIAKVGKDGIKIHNMKCVALHNLSFDKLLEAHWEGEEPNKYKFLLSLVVADKPGVLLNILTTFSDLNINIDTINAEKDGAQGQSILTIQMQFANPAKISFLLKELKKKDNFVKINSKNIF